jgi:uncharacterized iron-regulated membrane protein
VRQDAIALNTTGLSVTDTSCFADWPIGAKLARWGINAHLGLLFGIANQVALATLALLLLTLTFLGYRMWWQRRPRHGPALRMGRPMPRGGWRHVASPALVPLPLFTIAIGWFLPLLGITPAAFLVIDASIGAARRPRSSDC